MEFEKKSFFGTENEGLGWKMKMWDRKRNQKRFRVSKATSTQTNGNGKKESETSHPHQIPHLLRRLLCRTPTSRWKNTLIMVQYIPPFGKGFGSTNVQAFALDHNHN